MLPKHCCAYAADGAPVISGAALAASGSASAFEPAPRRPTAGCERSRVCARSVPPVPPERSIPPCPTQKQSHANNPLPGSCRGNAPALIGYLTMSSASGSLSCRSIAVQLPGSIDGRQSVSAAHRRWPLPKTMKSASELIMPPRYPIQATLPVLDKRRWCKCVKTLGINVSSFVRPSGLS
jgi:hypothetical protein